MKEILSHYDQYLKQLSHGGYIISSSLLRDFTFQTFSFINFISTSKNCCK